MESTSQKRLEWSTLALAAFTATLDKIAGEDPFTLVKFERRVARSLNLLQTQPALGTPSAVRGRRIYAIPGSGHSIAYRVTGDAVVILRWWRQRQNVRTGLR